MPSPGWIAGLLISGFLLGWIAFSILAWWRREDQREEEGFLGLFSSAVTHLNAGRIDEAIDELTRAARIRTDIAGVYLILGDLYRSRGQFDRAIRIHASLMGRGDISQAERALAHTGLGEDYRAAGFADRAREAYRQALDLDARSLPALKGLLSFEIEDRQWPQAIEHEERILRFEPTRPGKTLAYLHYEMGMEALRSDDEKGAFRAFQKAVAVDPRAYPAHLFLGDIHHKEGRLRRARESWEKIIELKPQLLHVVYDRLEQVYAEEGEADRLASICHRLAERDPLDWRVRILLARRENERGNPEAAYGWLLEAARIHPSSVSAQREIWGMTLQRGLDRRVAQQMADLVRGVDVFVDAFVCTTCRLRSRAYVWRCPRCHQWDTLADDSPTQGATEGQGAAEGRSDGEPDV